MRTRGRGGVRAPCWGRLSTPGRAEHGNSLGCSRQNPGPRRPAVALGWGSHEETWGPRLLEGAVLARGHAGLDQRWPRAPGDICQPCSSQAGALSSRECWRAQQGSPSHCPPDLARPAHTGVRQTGRTAARAMRGPSETKQDRGTVWVVAWASATASRSRPHVRCWRAVGGDAVRPSQHGPQAPPRQCVLARVTGTVSAAGTLGGSLL